MEEPQLPDSINPDAFPAKLWRLVNSPRFRSIYWDSRGRGLMIEEQLFVREVLGAGPAGEGAAGAANLFKTKSFTSFIRQLNLYGFRKLVKEPLVPGGSDGSGPISHLHYYHSPHFCRDRPDLIVHLKRLTRAKKVKLVASLELPSCFQPLPGKLLPSMPAKADGPGLTVGQFPQPYHQDNFFACSYTPTSSQNHSTSPTNSSEQTPVPSILWQGSFELLPGHGATPTFPDKGVAFRGLQSFPTEVTYTLQPVPSILPLQQESQTIATSFPKYSSFSPSVQYSQAYYPTAALQCCSPPAHTDPLPGCARPAASTYTHCSFFPENTGVECESRISETEESQFTSGTEPVTKSIEETDSSVKLRCGKRSLSSHKDEFPDLHLLEDRACKRGYFLKEETRE